MDEVFLVLDKEFISPQLRTELFFTNYPYDIIVRTFSKQLSSWLFNVDLHNSFNLSIFCSRLMKRLPLKLVRLVSSSKPQRAQFLNLGSTSRIILTIGECALIVCTYDFEYVVMYFYYGIYLVQSVNVF